MKLTNTTKSDYRLAGVVIPAGGSADVDDDAYTTDAKNPAVKAWLEAGYIKAEKPKSATKAKQAE